MGLLGNSIGNSLVAMPQIGIYQLRRHVSVSFAFLVPEIYPFRLRYHDRVQLALG